MSYLKYNKIVLEHFKNPKNFGVIEKPDVIGKAKSPVCGDEVIIYLKIENNKIKEIKFQSFGCASNIATTSVMTELVKGKSLEEAEKVDWKEIYKALGQLPPEKIHCSILAIDALKNAIEKYKGAKKEKTIEEKIKEELNKVIHPELKEGLVDLGKIKIKKEKNNKFKIILVIDNKEIEWKDLFIKEISSYLRNLNINFEIEIENETK